jgi:hypothetical protein
VSTDARLLWNAPAFPTRKPRAAASAECSVAIREGYEN